MLGLRNIGHFLKPKIADMTVIVSYEMVLVELRFSIYPKINDNTRLTDNPMDWHFKDSRC